MRKIGGLAALGLLASIASCSGSSNTSISAMNHDGGTGDASMEQGDATGTGSGDATAGAMDATGGDATPGAEGGATDSGDSSVTGVTDAASDASEMGTDATPSEGGGGSGGMDASDDTGSIVDANVPDVSFFYDAGEGGLCNSLANTAPVIVANRIYGTAPTASGGTVKPGVYYLMSETRYVPDDGGQAVGSDAGPTDQIQETVELVGLGGQMFNAAIAETFPTSTTAQPQSNNYDAVVTFSSDTMVIDSFTCGAPGSPPSFTFTFDGSSTPNKLTLFQANAGGAGVDAEQVYELQ